MKRFAIVFTAIDGLVKLAFTNHSEYHFDTEEEANKMLENMLKNNSPDKLRQVFSDPSTLRVKEIECYQNGDSVKTVFGPDVS